MPVTGRKLNFVFDVAARPRRRKVELRRWFAKSSTSRQTFHVRPVQMWLVASRLRAKSTPLSEGKYYSPWPDASTNNNQHFSDAFVLQLTFIIQRSWITELFILLVVSPDFESRKCFVEAIFCDEGTELAGKTTNSTFVKWFSVDCSRWCGVAGRARWLNGEESCFNVNLKSGVYGVIIRGVERTFARRSWVNIRSPLFWVKTFPFVSGFERNVLRHRSIRVSQLLEKTFWHVFCFNFSAFFLAKAVGRGENK